MSSARLVPSRPAAAVTSRLNDVPLNGINNWLNLEICVEDKRRGAICASSLSRASFSSSAARFASAARAFASAASFPNCAICACWTASRRLIIGLSTKSVRNSPATPIATRAPATILARPIQGSIVASSIDNLLIGTSLYRFLLHVCPRGRRVEMVARTPPISLNSTESEWRFRQRGMRVEIVLATAYTDSSAENGEPINFEHVLFYISGK